MKKLLALVLCIAMIASVCVFSTSAAANYAIMPGDKVIIGDAGNLPLNPNKSYDVEDMTLEFDLAFVEDNDKGVCGLGIDSTNGRLTISRFGIGFVDTYKDADVIQAAVTPFGDVQAAGWKNQHHLKIVNASSGVTIYVDGEEAFTSTDKIALWAGVVNLGAHAGTTAFKNLVMSTTSTGDVILSSDGSTLLNDQIGGAGGWGGGARIEEAPEFVPSYAKYIFKPDDKVIINVGGNLPLNPSKSYNVDDMTIEFDMAFVEDNENGVCGLGIDSTNGRLTVSRYGIGFVDTYKPADVVQAAVTPFGDVQAASWKNQHHFKIVNASSGVTIYVDGEQAFTSTDKIVIWAGVVNLGAHAGTVAFKNLVMSTTSSGEVILSSDGSTLLNHQIGGDGGWGGGAYIGTVPEYITSDPVVNVINGYTQLEYDGDLADKQVYTMDLALVPNENGVAEFTVWGGSNGTMDRAGIKLDANTGKATVGLACDNPGAEGHGDHGDFTAPVTVDWGTGSYNNMHKVVFTFDGTVTINIDGVDVYNSELEIGTNGNNFAVVMAANGLAAIDNFSLVSGSVNLVTDFEEGSVGIGGGSPKTLFPCKDDSHSFSKFYATTTQPTCTTKGEGTAICEMCGDATTTRSIDALGHNFTDNWDSANNVTADKREYNCKRCGEVASTSLPAAGDYKGTYSMYVDFNDRLMAEKVAGFDYGSNGYMSADGKYSANTSDKPCWQPGFSDKLNPQNGYVHSIDVRLNGTYDTDLSARDGHQFKFWFGGDGGLTVTAGIDFDTNTAFIAPWNNGTFGTVEAPFKVAVGEWHTYAVRYITDWEEMYACIDLIIDGNVICSVSTDDDEDVIWAIGCAEGSNSDLQCFWAQYIDVSFDNYVIGSYDFEWTNGAEKLGDVNGDGKVNMLDLLRAKKFVVGLVDSADVVAKNGDLDFKRDGITGTDIALLKRMIASL